MNKKIILLLIIFIFLSSGTVSAENNTSAIEHPTSYQSDLDTVKALESGDSNIQFSDGYKGYCIEWGEHSAEENETFYVDTSVDIKNKVTNEDVSNNLKVMFLFFTIGLKKTLLLHSIWFGSLLTISSSVNSTKTGMMK